MSGVSGNERGAVRTVRGAARSILEAHGVGPNLPTPGHPKDGAAYGPRQARRHGLRWCPAQNPMTRAQRRTKNGGRAR